MSPDDKHEPAPPQTPRPGASQDRVRRRFLVGLLVLVVIAVFGLQVRGILVRGSLPYPLHEDERHLTRTGLQMLQTGDYLPHWYRYPTPPIYATAAALGLGYLLAAQANDIRHVADVGSVAYPAYDRPAVVVPARLLFALLSVLALVFMGLVAYRVTGSPLVMVLAPLLLSASGTYLKFSWQYLNVDMFGCCSAWLALFYLFHRIDRPGIVQSAVVPGALCALCIGSKYNLWPIVVPFLLHLTLYRRPGWLRRGLLLLGVMLLAFSATTPFLFELPTFLDDIGLELRHYATGHAEYTSASVFAQLAAYLDDFVTNFGSATGWLALLGIGYSFRGDWRRAVLLVSYPLVLLAYMGAQKVFFVRNIISVFPFAALYAVLGVVCLAHGLAALLGRRLTALPRPRLVAGATLAVFTLLCLTLPWSFVVRSYDLAPDSRNQALAWINANAPPGSLLLVAEELQVDTHSVVDHEVLTFPYYQRPAEILRPTPAGRNTYVLLPVRDGAGWPELSRRLTTLATFGNHRLRPETFRPLGEGGDPIFAIASLR